MKYINNDKGIALMMVMIIAAMVLVTTAALLNMMISSTRMSGAQKRYTSALEAGFGGQSVVLEYIGSRASLDADFINAVNFTTALSDDCVKDKLNKSTSEWDSSCDASLVIDITDDETYDTSFEIGPYMVYSKIVNTIEGNTGAGSTGLKKSGVVAANSGEVKVLPVSAVYTIEVDARRIDNPKEKAKLSILYQY